jgi:hypothetical protein
VVSHIERTQTEAFKNRVLKRILGIKTDEIIVGLRKWHIEQLHTFYCSPNTIKIIKSRMRYAGDVARME